MSFLNISLLFYIASIIFTICLAVIIFFKLSYRYWTKLGVPYIKPKMFNGSLVKSTSLKSTIGEEMEEFYKEYKANGHKYVGIYFFHLPVLMVICPEFVKNIMTKHHDHFIDRRNYCNEENDPLSAHLFSLEGAKWKNLRKKLTPTFTSGKLKNMFQTLVDCAEELNSCLDGSIAKAEPIEIKKVMVQYTTDVIGSCAFGLDCNSFKNPDSEFIKYGHKIFNPAFFDRMKSFFVFVCPQLATLFKMRYINKDVDIFFRKLVKDTIEYRETNNISRNDFMQLLIQLKNKGVLDEDETNRMENPIGTTLTLNEASAQAFLFFIAGFETSSTTMTFCLHELAANPEIQEKARKEIVNVLKKYDGKITYDSIMEMRYMERVIQETLRKHPPVMVLERKVTKDYIIPETNLLLKNGLLILIPIVALQNDPEYFPNPEIFDPDRFTEEMKATRPDFTYLPFGEGPRNCIGLRFGMMQVKVGLCRLLLHYKFSPNPKTINPIELDPNSFIRNVKDGVWLNAEKITS